MKEKLMRFMQGRYGTDQFSKFLIGVGFVCIILSFFIRKGGVSSLLSGIIMILLVYVYFRMFSRNISKRYAENQKYLQVTSRFRGLFQKEKHRMEQRKDYRFYKCPACSQQVRVPKGKGKIEISCPKCQNKFVKRS